MNQQSKMLDTTLESANINFFWKYNLNLESITFPFYKNRFVPDSFKKNQELTNISKYQTLGYSFITF